MQNFRLNNLYLCPSEAVLILGATTHNQEFSSQTRGRRHPLRHLLRAIRMRRKGRHQIFLIYFFLVWTKQQSAPTYFPPLLLHLGWITPATAEKQFRGLSQGAPPLPFSSVLPGD